MTKKMRLFLLYWRRIVFTKNHLKSSILTKVKANIGGFLADQYVLYDFKNNDKNEYLSEFDWHRSRFINEPYDFILNNKVACTEVLKEYVNTPKIFAIRHKDILSSMDEGLVTYDDILNKIKEMGSVFVKPISAGKGNGVSIVKYKEDKYYFDDKKSSKNEILDYLKKNKDWIITETIEQHNYSKKIYDKTYNTIRLITMRDIDTNEFKVFFAVHRIGTSDTIPVDNGSRGGLVSNIDLETGVLSEAKSLHNLNVYETHPNSENKIKGVKVPNWEVIKEQMLILSNKLPYMYFIAWDIIIKPDGEISVIEANTSSGVNIIQLWGGQKNKELGNFFRHHKAIK